MMHGLTLAALLSSAITTDITLLDSETGQWQTGQILIGDENGFRKQSCSGQCNLALASGEHAITVHAAGYQALSTTMTVAPGAPFRWVFELNPGSATDQTRLKAHPANALSGHLTHAEDGSPLADARVALEPSGITSASNTTGRFQLPLPENDTRERQFLRISTQDREYAFEAANGFIAGERLRLAVPAGISQVIRPDHAAAQVEGVQRALPDLSALPTNKASITQRGLATLPPPGSIRVGDDCFGRVCDTVRVMSLPTYVRGGLAREWIASWLPASLYAGAIAYRSYAVWHIDNPVSSAYDICNSTSCQVWEPGSHPNTDAAVAATAGLLLNHPEESGAFRAEYSAENNNLLGSRSCSNSDLSCGDGAVGSPATGWPCLNDDPVATGQSCFGHGRGMSQWGTQGWAVLGYSWNWITNHYYNASGFGSGLRQAEITRPFATVGLDYDTSAVNAGSRLKLSWSTLLPETAAPLPVWFGASLRCGAEVFDDPDNDLAVTLQPGLDQISRSFRLNQRPNDGPCDVLVALYADGNLDGQLSGGDLVLVRRTEEAVLALDEDQLFRDDFRQ